MNKDCSELKTIIEELIVDIDHVKNIWGEIRELNPGFEQVSEESWQSKEARLWIHGATKTYEASELEQWLFATPALSKTAKSIALNHYFKWSEHILEQGIYADFAEDDLSKPQKKEYLIEYVIRLSQIVEDGGWGTKKRKRALKSFLHFMRQGNKQEEVAFIEHIFPQKIDLRGGRIIRKIRPQVESIPHQVAGAIIKELAHQCAFGRTNARHHAGEALALIWLCLSSSRIRWPRYRESVYAIERDSIVFGNEYPELLAPSLFGPYGVRIGKQVAKFLQAIADIPSKNPRTTILQTSLPDLHESLGRAIENVKPTPGLGMITFLTFLSYPHHFGKDIR